MAFRKRRAADELRDYVAKKRSDGHLVPRDEAWAHLASLGLDPECNAGLDEKKAQLMRGQIVNMAKVRHPDGCGYYFLRKEVETGDVPDHLLGKTSAAAVLDPELEAAEASFFGEHCYEHVIVEITAMDGSGRHVRYRNVSVTVHFS